VSGLAFLVRAVLLSAVGSLVLWLRERTPTSTEHAIESFSRQMAALSPRAPRGRGRARRPPPG
jgi:hypothetical protein